jgi:probable HAF family extracellular repeat protein
MARHSLSFLRPIYLALAVVCLLLLAAISVAAQTAQYTITDLGPFRVIGMNDLGQAVGEMGGKPALYQAGSVKVIQQSVGYAGEAWAVNNFGHVVGRLSICDLVNGNCVNGRSRGFIYRNGVLDVMATLGGRDSDAQGINDAGQITGWSDSGGPASEPHAFIFQNGTFQDIGTVIGARSRARSINSRGWVVGVASSSSNNGAFFFVDGNTTFFEVNGFGTDLNDMGQVVGGYGGNDDGSRRAYLYSNRVRYDLGSLTPAHTYNEALAINNNGQIVGISSLSFFTRADERAFIYNNGVMQDLNALIPAGSGWVLNTAVDINSGGQIVGNGKLNGQDRAFLLTPTEPVLLSGRTNDVIALESVSFMRGPFRPFTSLNLDPDQRTRITLVTRNVDIVAGENIPAPAVTAENAQHQVFSLPVEYFGRIPDAEWLTQIVVRLPENITTGDLQVTVTFRSRVSKPGLLTIAAP